MFTVAWHWLWSHGMKVNNYNNISFFLLGFFMDFKIIYLYLTFYNLINY